MKKRIEQKVIFVSLLLFFIFNVPFLFLSDRNFGQFEMPAIYVGIFAGWLLTLGLTYAILKRNYSKS